MAENFSPEERLFKVIQDGKSTTSGKIGRKARTGFFGLNKFFGNLRPRAQAPAASIKETGQFLGLGGFILKLREFDVRSINKALVIILAVLTAVVIYFAVSNKQSVSRIINNSPRGNAPTLIKEDDIKPFASSQAYLEEIKKRDIFRPYAKQVKGITASSRLLDMAKDLSLAGIYWGERPEVMIENKAEKKTYFLKQGDEIKGIKIKSILKDRVILEYNDEETELL